MYIYGPIYVNVCMYTRAASARGVTRNTPADAYRYVIYVYICI